MWNIFYEDLLFLQLAEVDLCLLLVEKFVIDA